MYDKQYSTWFSHGEPNVEAFRIYCGASHTTSDFRFRLQCPIIKINPNYLLSSLKKRDHRVNWLAPNYWELCWCLFWFIKPSVPKRWQRWSFGLWNVFVGIFAFIGQLKVERGWGRTCNKGPPSNQGCYGPWLAPLATTVPQPVIN